MSDKPKLSMKQQRQSIVDAAKTPELNRNAPPELIQRIQQMMASPPPEPPVDPRDAQFQAEAGPDAIAAMQERNIARAQNDPTFAAKLAAVEQERRRQRELQTAKLQTAIKARQAATPPAPTMPQIGQTYPAEE